MTGRFARGLGAALLLAAIASVAAAGQPEIEYGPVAAELVAVPQTLLKLAHSEEVQKDLGLSSTRLVEWEEALRTIDRDWWPSRIRPFSERRATVARLEAALMSDTERLLGDDAVKRLRQIELQSQGCRVLARPEVERFLQLDPKQRKKLAALFLENDRLADEIASAKPPGDPAKQRAFDEAKASEAKRALAVLTESQANRIRDAMGKPIETAGLKRVYPLAPELIDSNHWTTSERVTLEALRGQVVLVHFYAFQCHNCVANFDHYKRWDETLRSQGVRLIGIQTPETSAERDAERVVAAARKEGFRFPVLIDLANKNWDAWGTTMWPTVYVIDKRGYIRFWWQGELNWEGATVDKEIETVIANLLKE